MRHTSFTSFTSAESQLSQTRRVDVSDEEEDEEVSAPLPVEGAQEEKEEQGEQQVDGKDTNTETTKWRKFFSHYWTDHLCIDTPKELTEEEKLQVLHSEDFLTFFERGSRIVERALAEQVDVCFDYSGRDLEDKEG